MNKLAYDSKSVLPENSTSAVLELAKITQRLIDLSERETQALLQNDLLSFGVLQDEKNNEAQRYALASEAFRNRLSEFRGVDKALINKLDSLQIALSEKANENNSVIERMRARAEKNTTKTLMTVQELAQKKPVKIDPNYTQQKGA